MNRPHSSVDPIQDVVAGNAPRLELLSAGIIIVIGIRCSSRLLRLQVECALRGGYDLPVMIGEFCVSQTHYDGYLVAIRSKIITKPDAGPSELAHNREPSQPTEFPIRFTLSLSLPPSNILQSIGSSGNVFLSAFPADRIRQAGTHEREEGRRQSGKETLAERTNVR